MILFDPKHGWIFRLLSAENLRKDETKYKNFQHKTVLIVSRLIIDRGRGSGLKAFKTIKMSSRTSPLIIFENLPKIINLKTKIINKRKKYSNISKFFFS